MAATVAAQSQVEPKGGTWKTWVLASGSQVRLAPPPDAASTKSELAWIKTFQAGLDSDGKGQIAYWDQGPASYHWVQWLQHRLSDQMNAGTVSNPSALRQLALLNVAVYDAMVAAWDSKYFYNRPKPAQVDSAFHPLLKGPDVPSYPNEFAVAAGAAAAVLKYLYPKDAQSIQDLAEEAARSRVAAGVAFPSDSSAGLQLGAQVGQRVVDWAKSDGSDAVWTGSVPTTPGSWNGANPVCPLCGTWKPWVLTSGSQFRSGPPLAYDSPEKQVELAIIRAQPRTFYDTSKAFYYQSPPGIFSDWYNSSHTATFEDQLTGNSLRCARAFALISVASYDSMIAVFDTKYTYWAIRPVQLDPALTTLFPTPNHPSYPSAHSAISTATMDVLAYLYPTRAFTFRSIAIESGWSRIVAGIHFPSDIESGTILGHKVGQAVIDWANSDGSQ